MRVGEELGSHTRFVDQAEMRARGIPPAFLFGSEQRGGTLNPGKYVSGLRRAAIQAGIKIYEKHRCSLIAKDQSLPAKPLAVVPAHPLWY